MEKLDLGAKNRQKVFTAYTYKVAHVLSFGNLMLISNHIILFYVGNRFQFIQYRAVAS